MGFYGNTIYNTYGLQDKSVQPRHLDRNYWRWGRKIGVSSFQELRKKVLNLPKIDLNIDNDTYFTEQNWKDCWAEAEKSMFAFHFSNNAKLRRVFGTSLILGWVLKETVVNNEAKQYGPSYTMKGETSAYQYVLYMLCLGNAKRDLQNKPGSLFKIALNLTDDEDEDNRMPDAPLEAPSPYKEEGVNWVNNDFLVGPVISSVHLLKNSVITEKIKALNVTDEKLADEAVITRTIHSDAVIPSKLDRDYWERTLLGTITTYTDLFTKCAKVSTTRNQDNITNNGTLYVCSSLQLPLPEYYTNPNDKDNCLKSSSGLYDIGRCLLWYYSNTIYVISASKGQIWKIDLVSSLPSDSATQKKYYTEEGKYYLPVLNQTISPMIANSSILPNKLDRDYLEKIYISNIKGYDALFNEDNLKPISSTTTSVETVNKSSSLYFLGNIFLENLPSQYTTSDNGYYISPNNQETASKDTYRYVLGRSLVWKYSNTTIYIISNTTGYTWKIDRVSRDASGSQIVDTGNVDYKYSITLNTIPSNLIQNKSISTIKIADYAVTRDKILDGEIITIKIADDAITSAKIAENQIEGGDYGHIKENTITSYNMADDAITSAKIAESQIEGGDYGHIKSSTITSYNIAPSTITDLQIQDNSISAEKLKEQYARCHYGKGTPDDTVTAGLIEKGLYSGDIYIDVNTGLTYCYKGYNFYKGQYEWISYVCGSRGTGFPANASLGDIWVDNTSGKVYVYQTSKITGAYGWQPLQTYQDIQNLSSGEDEGTNPQIHYISGDVINQGETGLYTRLLALLKNTSLAGSGIFIFQGDYDDTIPEGERDVSVFYSGKLSDVYVGMVSESVGGRYTLYNMVCTNITTGERFKISTQWTYSGTGAGVVTFSLSTTPLGPVIPVRSQFKEGKQPPLYTLAYDTGAKKLNLYNGTEWQVV